MQIEFTFHCLKPVYIAGLQQVWISDGSSRQRCSKKGKVFLRDPGEG